VIQCKHCGKENQDHYKFCLGCGVELKKEAPSPALAPTPVPATAPKADVVPATMFQPPAAAPAPIPQTTKTAPAHAPLPKPAPAAAPMDDGALFASAAAATLEPKPAGRQRLPTPAKLSSPATDNVRDTLSEAAPPSFEEENTKSGAAQPPVPAAQGAGAPCPNCGTFVPQGFLFCGSCGTRIAPAGAAPPPNEPGTVKTMFMAGAQPAAAAQPRGKLILIRSDGSEGGTHPLMDGTNLIGRTAGGMFESDGFLSPRHAELVVSGSSATVRDLHSLNGVFVKLLAEEEIPSGTTFRIGQELLRYDAIPPPTPLEDGTEVMGSPNPGFWGRLAIIVGRDQDGSAFPLFGDGVVLGRERGDILFPEDGYVSGTHARISYRDGKFYLADLGSSNGTFLRIRGDRTLKSGGFLLMGQQLFKLQF
jgi:pSer/pThr/pTyr-binding forkhead associated (FHA) protein